jgi:PhnB protein
MDTQRPVCPPGLNWLTPFLNVRDADKALDFYVKIFGFQEHQRVLNREKKIIFARMTYRGCNVVILPHAPFALESHRGEAPTVTKTTSPISLYVYCDDVDQRYHKANDAGLKILLPLGLRFWGDKTFRVEDPEGYIWDFATCVADFDPSKLPPELL